MDGTCITILLVVLALCGELLRRVFKLNDRIDQMHTVAQADLTVRMNRDKAKLEILERKLSEGKTP